MVIVAVVHLSKVITEEWRRQAAATDIHSAGMISISMRIIGTFARFQTPSTTVMAHPTVSIWSTMRPVIVAIHFVWIFVWGQSVHVATSRVSVTGSTIVIIRALMPIAAAGVAIAAATARTAAAATAVTSAMWLEATTATAIAAAR